MGLDARCHFSTPFEFATCVHIFINLILGRRKWTGWMHGTERWDGVGWACNDGIYVDFSFLGGGMDG